jgi:hypothetical protein
MTTSAQKKANASYRARLAERGLIRLEIVVPEKNKDMIKAIAEQLTVAAGQDAPVETKVDGTEPVPTGREIWQSLREAPRELGELELDRADFKLRTIEL